MQTRPTDKSSIALVRRYKRAGAGFHFGVLRSDDSVVELQPQGYRTLSLGEFSGGAPIRLLRRLFEGDALHAIARLGHALEQQRPYHTASWNCESFARYVIEGRAHSNETKAAAIALVALTWIGMSSRWCAQFKAPGRCQRAPDQVA